MTLVWHLSGMETSEAEATQGVMGAPGELVSEGCERKPDVVDRFDGFIQLVYDMVIGSYRPIVGLIQRF